MSLFAGIPMYGQTVSPLFQVMSSNSLINRPEAFRELQDYLNQRYENVPKGLQLDYFYDKIGQGRSLLLEKIKAPTLVLKENNTKLVATYEGKELTIDVKEVKKVATIIHNLHDLLNDSLRSVLQPLIKKIGINDQEEKAVISSLLIVLKKSGIVEGEISLGNSSQDLAQVIVSILIQKVEEIIHRSYPEILFTKNFTDFTDIDKIRTALQEALNNAAQKIREDLEQVLDKAENEVAKVIDTYSQKMVSGNMGASVTEGTGAFAGGITVSFYSGSTVQFGFYANGQFNKGDSTRPTQSLAGGQFRFAEDAWQAELLLATLFGKEQFVDLNVFEIGCGLSYRANDDLILGVAYFNTFSSSLHSLQIGGVMFKGTSPESPGLMFGIQGEKYAPQETKLSPVFQISFPILPSR